jgi:hypothetical protein
MTLEAIYYIGQTIAVIAILISLIFVGIQIRDGNHLARAQMHQQIADNFTQVMQLAVDGDEEQYAALFSAEKFQNLSRVKLENLNARLLGIWKHYENVFYQHKNGFLHDAYWQSTMQYLAVWKAREGATIWWNGRKHTFAADFVTFVDSLEMPIMPVDMKQIAEDAARVSG